MFEPCKDPRIFGCALGVDFPAAVIRGLEHRMQNATPDAWARITLLVNTRRMARRLRDIFDAGPPRLLPRIRMLNDLDDLLGGDALAPAGSALRRRLDLLPLTNRLIEQQTRFAPRTAGFDMADSLATLMDEMQGEGVTAADIAELDVSDQSGHWERAQQFIAIAQSYIARTDTPSDAEGRQRQTVLRLADLWAQNPITDPVLAVGSTGSRGTTQLLMQAIAHLPQGAVILPGFDFDMPHVWDSMSGDTAGEDHPQYRFVKLAQRLSIHPNAVRPWVDDRSPTASRNRLISLALRPAPVTDAWRTEGPDLADLVGATAPMTLVEADTPRAEAMAIAMRLRTAAETGQRAALITPDRMLTRQVTAALDRWDILPDDSAGTPLHLSPPGRFLRHVLRLFERPLDAEAMLTLLKHPLTHSGADRRLHGLRTQKLELKVRRRGLPYPDRAGLIACAQAADENSAKVMAQWATWIADHLCDQTITDTLNLVEWINRHMALAEAIAHGPQGADGGELWQKKAGQEARKTMQAVMDEASTDVMLTASDYATLINGVLSQGEVRDRDAPHSGIMIWGTLEARVQGADLVILAGLNEGTWPEAPKPDPWLNRKMRSSAGLLLPERRIGLSAHDFQQAVAAPEVWLTRAIRSDDAETVPSRWINRLKNLTQGLAKRDQPDVWKQMKDRGQLWLARVQQLEFVQEVEKAHRPAPCPPVSARPRRMTVTEIQTLIRDPYAIYAKHCLRLRALDPLVRTPDALLRGILAHDVMEHFVKATLKQPNSCNRETLLQIARTVLNTKVPWPAARALWLARFERAAQWITTTERERQSIAVPTLLEKDAIGRLHLPSVATNLEGRADRIDVDDRGAVILYDYKSGTPPTEKKQRLFDKQLLIEAAMVEEGAFAALGPRTVCDAQFIGLGSDPKTVGAPISDEPGSKVLAELVSLLSAYLEGDKGYTSRRAMENDTDARDYDQLARFGEWDVSVDPVSEVLT